MKRYFDGMNTPIGRIHIVATDSAIVRLHLPGESWSERYERAPKHELVDEAKTQLAEYFAGARRLFDLPLGPEGTDFQKKVWGILLRIPYGVTMTYGEEAKRLRKPDAVRAVASANAKNPIPIIVPCHRVIPKSGGVGGYAGGSERKKVLLKLEQHFAPPKR